MWRAAAPSPIQVCAWDKKTNNNNHQLHVYVWLKWLLHVSGEKRKISEALTLEDAKRIRVMGDIPMELVNEVMMTITDPAAMLGPEVKSPGGWLAANPPLFTVQI